MYVIYIYMLNLSVLPLPFTELAELESFLWV